MHKKVPDTLYPSALVGFADVLARWVMFYGGVVVLVGSQVLGSDTQQGFITKAATNYLNIAGAVCLTIWAENLWHERQRGVSKLEGWGLAFNILLPASLIMIHFLMDRALDTKTESVIDHVHFSLFHKPYIATSSVQWVVSLWMLFLAIRCWNKAKSPSFT